MSKIIDIDFETYSEAGYKLAGGKWVPVHAGKPGIKGVGAAAYAMHLSTRVLCLVYDGKLWTPRQSNPKELFDPEVIIRAHNVEFEYYIWNYVCTRLYGWPPIDFKRMICTAAQCRSHGLPGSLEDAGKALNLSVQKDLAGAAVMRKLSQPGKSTATALDHVNLYNYCDTDVKTQKQIALRTPALTQYERRVWELDQRMNARGVAVDLPAVERMIKVYESLTQSAAAEVLDLTNGAVKDYNKVAQIKNWLGVSSLTADVVEEIIASNTLSAVQRRVLEIRQTMGAAAVKKLYSLRNHACPDGRVRGMLVYCGAERTGRFAGRGPQPQNFPNSCSIKDLDVERVCAGDFSLYKGQEVEAISGSLRGLFIGNRFIASDYSAIEAVVLAMIAGEQWRIEVFRTHGMIYEMSASKISGIPFEEFIRHKKETGEHHPMRKKVGKVAELASGYQGGVGAWKNFGADEFMTDEEIKTNIKKWREESPQIVRFWYGVEEAALKAVASKSGQKFSYRDITYFKHNNILFCRLPSGRHLRYHQPRIGVNQFGNPAVKFMGYNSNPKMGAMGWTEIDTYGGKLTENCIADGTLVLTNVGWVPIEKVSKNYLVHDGVEFVNHLGYLNKGVQPCVLVDGVAMTEDHKVLTKNGWKTASQQPEPYRPKIRNANCNKTKPHRRQKMVLDILVRLREVMHKSFSRCIEVLKKGEDTKLWMQNQRTTRETEDDARNDKTPSLLGVALYDRPMQIADASSLEKLRGAWDLSLPNVAKKLSKFLGGYEARVQSRSAIRSGKQQPGLFPVELSLGCSTSERFQQTEQCFNRWVNSVRICETTQAKENHGIVQSKSRVAYGTVELGGGCNTKAVGDLVNCGPRNRFVVLGNNGPFIVHNCVQAISRDILVDAMLRLDENGYPPVLSVHDEIISEVAPGTGSVSEFEQIMADHPDWAKDYPVRAAGGWEGLRYRK